MKYAADFRELARNALRGKWGIAVIVGLVAVLLGGAGNEGPEINLNIEGGNANLGFEIAGQTIFSTGGGLNSDIGAFLAGSAIYIMLAALVIAAIHLFLGSVVGVGYSRFNLELIDHNEAGFEHLFKYFPWWANAVCTRLLKGLYVFLWSLLLVIPGIVASYSYAMTEYILAEHPETTASEAIAASKEMMSGNRWRLFCLHVSFIGWAILCAFTLGIGNLWLNPYKNAATAAFYREISGTEQPTIQSPQDNSSVWTEN